MPRPLTLFLAVAAALLVAHTALWRWADGRLESGFTDWVAAQRESGWTVTSGRKVNGGWPFHAALDIDDVAISGGTADIPGGVKWEDGRLRLSVSLFHPRVLLIALDRTQKLRIGALPELAVTAETMTLQVPLETGAPSREADVRATHLRVGLLGDGSAPALTFALAQAHVESQPDATQGEAALSFAGSAQDIGLPPPPPRMGASWPLGPRIASFSAEGALTGPVSRAADPRARAAAWRDGGGTLEIRRLATGWGPLGLSLSATLALDEQLQPMGAGTAHLIGQNETIDAMAAAHIITSNAATAAKAVLGLIAHVPEGGGSPEAEVPLKLQNQVLSVGRIPLLKVPPLTWPAQE